MDLVLEVCVWGWCGMSLQRDKLHEGGWGSARGRGFASKLSASRGVGLCVRLQWPLAAFCALHMLVAMVWATDAGFDARAQAFRLATADAVVKASREQRGWGDNLFGC